MAFTNTASVYNRYSSTGQIPILKSDLTKLSRDVSNMQEYFATNSTVNKGRHAQLLLAYHSTGTNAEATTVNTNGYPATNIALRHLKNATLISSGSTSFQPTAQALAMGFHTTFSTILLYVRKYTFVTVTTSISNTSIFPKLFHFGNFIITNKSGGGTPFEYGTFAHTKVNSVTATTNNVTYSSMYGVEIDLGEGSPGFIGLASAVTGPVLSGFYKFYACDVEE